MTPGSSLAHYRILTKIGEGGMGAVYRASDTKLNRDVAIKVLPDSFGQDPARLSRFTREAQILAALNHPNIASIYGVEDHALVMELVDGETLAERIAAGPIPVEEAVPIARQIAEALEYAHERGVVHRDLKPANIKVTPDGLVKVLDFGLAKAMDGDVSEPSDAMNSPTLSMRQTQMGLILGTASYMSPEQAAGKPVDKRADIWSFGVVLWEMLSGQMLFKGESVPHTLADVLRRDIDLQGLPATTPRPIRELLRRCLDRDLKQRLRDIGEARIALQRWQAAPAEAQPSAVKPGRSLTWIPWAVACAILAAVSVWLWTRPSAPDTAEVRFGIEAPPGFSFRSIFSDVAISPDGRDIVFGVAPNNMLWVRPIDSVNARPLPGTEHATLPFWSPDSKSLGFFADGKLKRIALAGGAPVILCDSDLRPGGGTWNKEGVILFGGTTGVQRVSAAGGMRAAVTKLEGLDTGHVFPQFLPDGRRFLFYVGSSDTNVLGTYASSLDRPTERTRILAAPFKSSYVPARGNRKEALLWLRDQTLLAQPLDSRSLRLSGDPMPVAEGIATTSSGPVRASFFVSDAGVLAFHTGVAAGRLRIVWRDRDGKELGEVGKEDAYSGLRLSPDGKRVVVGRNESPTKSDFWVFDIGRPVMTRLTFDGTASRRASGSAVWSPDGRSIAFTMDRNGVPQIFRTNAIGSGREEQLSEGPGSKEPTDWSRDGRYLIFNSFIQQPYDVRALWLDAADPAGGRKTVPVVQSRKNAGSSRLSPDGKWIAYDSDESGRYEVYVQPFSPSGGQTAAKWHVSDHGIRPRWSPDGKELFYYDDDRLMAVSVSANGSAFTSETPHELFRSTLISNVYSGFDVSPDGKRFLMFAPPITAAGASLTVVVNWQAALR